MNSKPPNIFYDGILSFVEKPSRYIDTELNMESPGYGEDRFNVLLVFPDTYEVGMSHQGIRLLYHRLTALDGVGVEFAFAPWTDCEKLMRAAGEPLCSWRSATPARRFDLIGISLTYELHYTNLLLVLDLMGLELDAEERRDDDPVVVVGGPCCTNPLPFLDAVDAVFLGDGEESLVEAVEAMRARKARGAGRTELREALAAIEGVYVDGITKRARVRTYDFSEGDLPRRPIVPSSSIVHDRLAVEIMRGCARGCRFCHAGFVYRPCRERDPDEIARAVTNGLDASGWDEVSLLSLSSSDYSQLDELLLRLEPELEERTVSLALPSLRPETVSERLVYASSLVRRSGFTLAPEAGTERLRSTINKGMSDEEILRGCRRIVEGGWRKLKLYFMIGLPTETEADLEGIVSLVEKILKLPGTRGRFRLAISVSPFVPKPHTPFQWERQFSIEELTQKEEYLNRRLRNRRVELSLREPEISILEGVLARGSRELWPALKEAFRLGCRFDGWRNKLRFDLWREALERYGLELSLLTGVRETGGGLPWSRFVARVTESHLLAERDRALTGSRGTAGGTDRRAAVEEHTTCGSDDGSAVGTATPRIPPVPGPVPIAAASGPKSHLTGVRYRCLFEKVGRARFLTHLETIGIIQRALRRSGLPLNFTRGYHPHPRFSAGPSLAVGMEGLREFFDFELTSPADVAHGDFDTLFPEGMRVTDCRGPFTRREGKLPAEALMRYELLFGPLLAVLGSFCDETGQPLDESEAWFRFGNELGFESIGGAFAEECLPNPAAWVGESLCTMFEEGMKIRNARGRERTMAGCTVRAGSEPHSLELGVPAAAAGTLRPRDILESVLPEPLAALVGIRRLEILYKTGDSFVDPLALVERGGPREEQ
jgi:radical SAM superfamily enzyme YgiQ (UPF0313 family)